MSTIDDGGGKNGKATVSTTQRLDVSARVASRPLYAARDGGLSFSAIYHGTAAAGDYVAYLKNTSSSKNLFIGDISIGAVETVLWKMFFVTGTAAAGESVTPTPTNRSKSIPAEATAMAGDTAITGLTADGEFSTIRSAATNNAEERFDGSLILGPGDAIAVEYDTGTTGIFEVDINFHYESL